MNTGSFGGKSVDKLRDTTIPSHATIITDHRQPVWVFGEWSDNEARTARGAERTVTVFGLCSARPSEIQGMADQGVDDARLSTYAGSFTVVESTDQMTVVHSDAGHAQPVYVASAPEGWALWASSSLTLASLVRARPDPAWLADLLLAPHRPYLLAGRSAFTGISMVEPGHRLVMTENSWESHPGWRPPAAVSSTEEGAVLLRSALERAVRTRVGGLRRWSADCSGGLDSTTLALVAASQSPAGAHGRAVTIHPDGVIEGGDLDYARTAIQAYPNVQHVFCAITAQQLPYSRMTELAVATDEPAPGTVTLARLVAEFELLQTIGVTDCHLTGDGGDTLLGGHPEHLAELRKARNWRLLFQHTVGWAHLHRTQFWPLLRTTDAAQRRADQETPRWATEHARQASLDRGHGRPVESDKTLEAIRIVGRTARSDIQTAEKYGIRIHNPFVDPQVIYAALSTPSHRRASPYQYKVLLAKAASHVLPGPVARRQSKGDFTPDHYLGLRANLSEVNELANGMLAELDLVHPARLRQILFRAASGMPVAFSEFEPVLTAEVWLRAVEAALPTVTWRLARGAGRRLT
jgi:asparagine synthase (glutamine-hydrolysing)